ncbi:MAG TPA: ABC transporter permease [Candidatus Polarisedimenticolia bacterium]|nr:ABC transporter permease [Candidatus Polarisedimenticolia bacterium]
MSRGIPLSATLRVSLGAIGSHRVRSALTMLGVIIGVASVITMVSLGQGARAQVQAEIQAMGSNILYVWPGSQRTGGFRGGAGTITTLVESDVAAILRECPAVRIASPTVNARSIPLVFGNQNWSSNVEGVNEMFPAIRNWPMASGSFFTETDVRTAARTAVLGRTVAESLFAGTDPVGQTIRVRNMPFQVAGVLAPKGQNQWGRDQDDVVILPYTTVQKKILAITHLHGAILGAASARETFAAEEQVVSLLRQRHGTPPDGEDDFMVRNLTDFIEAATESQRTLSILLGSVAGVSLLVGGIGIMNIMLVSVTERTREIGLRVAVGARKSQVQTQFLLESIVLSTVGGLLGIAVGVGLSALLAGIFNWPMLVSPGAIGISVLFSGAVGVLFGYYPARKASCLDPIEALRYE